MKTPFEITLKNPERLGYFGQSLAIQVCVKHLRDEGDVDAIEDGSRTVLVVHTNTNTCHSIQTELFTLEKKLTGVFLEAYHSLLKTEELYAPAREPYKQAS